MFVFALAAAGVAAPSSAQTPPLPGYVAAANSITEIQAAVDYTNSDGDTLRLYRAFLDREPDVPGARYWIAQTRNGSNLDDLAWGFAQSEEFMLQYGTLSNEQFLALIYQNMLGRQPDAGGFQYWLDQMNDGLGQSGVVRWVVANEEFVNNYPYPPLDPGNPGDVVNCNDFGSQAQAQQWFEHYLPQHGDVARLDQNNDGVACESL